jgi:hypothetical protein
MRIISIRPDRAAFRDTKVGDLIDAGFEDLLRGKLVQDLPRERQERAGRKLYDQRHQDLVRIFCACP